MRRIHYFPGFLWALLFVIASSLLERRACALVAFAASAADRRSARFLRRRLPFCRCVCPACSATKFSKGSRRLAYSCGSPRSDEMIMRCQAGFRDAGAVGTQLIRSFVNVLK